MLVTRRDFVRAAAGTLAAAPGLARASSQPEGRSEEGTWFQWKDAAPGAHVAIGEGGNSTIIIDGEHALLIDTKNAPFGATLRREAGRLGTGITTVVNTHHHADHTAGNSAFTSDVPVLAHVNAVPRILKQTDRYRQMLRGWIETVGRAEGRSAAVKNQVTREAEAQANAEPKFTPESWAPAPRFAQDEDLEVGDAIVAVRHFGAGHTDNDLVLYAERPNLLVAGDLLFHKMHPFMDPSAGATSLGWIESLKKAIALCDERTVVVPGHGEITDVTGLRGQVEYFERTRAAVAEAVKAGKTKEEAQAIEVPEYKDFGLREMARKRALAAIFDEIKAGK